MAEKRKPNFDLDAIKGAFSSVARLNVTTAAVKTAARIGFDRSDIVATIQTMHRSQFYKSMTAYADHRVSQDVYHVPSSVGVLYVKSTADIVSEFLLLSFKEGDND
jgi:motility quorum-sensing regulator/GCU-specific mRNA interferase toxin